MTQPTTQPTTRPTAPLRLEFAAISDVGRVRKDNQDSGYAGPWLLSVCDGVGGAARGDIASSTAIQQLRKLDEPPTEDLLGQVAGALHRAHDRIGELVDEDPALNGTSTTATVALFDGTRLGLGHVGDSRAYLYRSGEITQLTKDHTFVQSLIDEGRITEDEARVHPHRNLILKALDGIHEAEPDLFHIGLAAGDRILLCSDGASGVPRRRQSGRHPLDRRPGVRRGRAGPRQPGGRQLRQRHVHRGRRGGRRPPRSSDPQPVLVGAAAELRRRSRSAKGSLFRGHRSGDTGELEPVAAEIPDDVPFAISSDPLDPEQARYAPRPPRRFVWLKRLLAGLIVLGLLWVGLAAAWSWSQQQYYVGEDDGTVVIYRGLNADLPGVSLSTPYETTDVRLARLSDFDAGKVREGIDAGSLDDARRAVDNLASKQSSDTTAGG